MSRFKFWQLCDLGQINQLDSNFLMYKVESEKYQYQPTKGRNAPQMIIMSTHAPAFNVSSLELNSNVNYTIKPCIPPKSDPNFTWSKRKETNTSDAYTSEK